MTNRFDSSQNDAMKGVLLLPPSVITDSNWQSTIKSFVDLYLDDLPSRHTLHAELVLWSRHWEDYWEDHLTKLKQQHLLATGDELRVSPPELKKLKISSVPCTIKSTLLNVNPDIFPNIFFLLNLLAIFPVTTCEVERCVSSLRRLKTYLRSTMGQSRLTGLALMHVHQHISVDIDAIVNQFAVLHPRRMKLGNILHD